jgi:thymidylate synthase (FAD)
VRIICDRGVTHELVRHRLCSFSQESTRYANYAQDKFGREITVIRPYFWAEEDDRYRLWLTAMQACEDAYLRLVDAGATAQEARSVLPNSLKTEIVTTANIREWRHIFKLRCDKAAHPQMRQVMLPLLAAFNERIPLLYDDLAERFSADFQEMADNGSAARLF